MIISEKLTLQVVGSKEKEKEVIKELSDAIQNVNKAYNVFMCKLYEAECNGASEDEIKEIIKLGSHEPGANSLYSKDKFKFPKGMNAASTIEYEVNDDYRKAKRKGLIEGKSKLPQKRIDSSMMIATRFIKLKYGDEEGEIEEHAEEIEEHLNDKNLDVRMYFSPKSFLRDVEFKIVFGDPEKSHEKRMTIYKISNGTYKQKSSSIQIDGKKIKLNLNVEIPKENIELDPNLVVGVDMGIAVPAYCALYNSEKDDFEETSEKIGSSEACINKILQIKNQRELLQKELKYNSGGHGRKKKLKALNRFKAYEKNFAKTKNHQYSRAIVEYALKCNAKYINVEKLKFSNKMKKENKLLGNWRYYQLRQFIKYKAEKYGIEVREIDPYNTSRKCSWCGYTDEKNRDKRNFECLKCGKKSDADFNAARNIAKSINFQG